MMIYFNVLFQALLTVMVDDLILKSLGGGDRVGEIVTMWQTCVRRGGGGGAAKNVSFV